MSRVLVTGASGFIGVNVAKYLAEMKRKVLCATRSDGPDPLVNDYLRGLDDYVEWVKVDLTDFERVISIASRYKLDAIIHSAIFTAATKEIEQSSPREILASNLMGTVNTLELARRARVNRFVYVSSSALYAGSPDPNRAETEDSPRPYLQMSGFYHITKIACEKLTERYSQLFPIISTSMRIAAPYGCMERPTRSRSVMGLIFSLLKLLLTDGKKVIRVKGLDYARDWTYVRDTARGLISGLEAPAPISPIYNVSCGVNSSLEEILSTLQEVSGSDFEWEETREEKEADLICDGDRPRGPLSVQKTRRELGFTPKFSLKQGIREYCDWWKAVTKKGLLTTQ
jgi:nucleoside-diphosphate-sugar epimerase